MSIRPFLEQRQAVLVREREDAVVRLEVIDSELREISVALTAIGETPGLLKLAAGLGSADTSINGLTLKQLTVRALQDNFPAGASAGQLLDAFKNAYGREVERSSLSPQLSRLKDAGVIELDGRLWRLARKENSPEAIASSGVVGGANSGMTLPLSALGLNYQPPVEGPEGR